MNWFTIYNVTHLRREARGCSIFVQIADVEYEVCISLGEAVELFRHLERSGRELLAAKHLSKDCINLMVGS